MTMLTMIIIDDYDDNDGEEKSSCCCCCNVFVLWILSFKVFLSWIINNNNNNNNGRENFSQKKILIGNFLSNYLLKKMNEIERMQINIFTICLSSDYILNDDNRQSSTKKMIEERERERERERSRLVVRRRKLYNVLHLHLHPPSSIYKQTFSFFHSPILFFFCSFLIIFLTKLR